MDPKHIPATVTLTTGPLPTIKIEGFTLTLDTVRQLDTLTVERLEDLQALNPIARIQTTKHRTRTEVLAQHPTTGRLIRAEVDNYHVHHPSSGRPAYTGVEATTWAQEHLTLAVLPRNPQAEQ